MNFEIIKTETTEFFANCDKISIQINLWGNLEGASLVVTGNGENMPIRMFGSFTWQEWAAIQSTIMAAQI